MLRADGVPHPASEIVFTEACVHAGTTKCAKRARVAIATQLQGARSSPVFAILLPMGPLDDVTVSFAPCLRLSGSTAVSGEREPPHAAHVGICEGYCSCHQRRPNASENQGKCTADHRRPQHGEPSLREQRAVDDPSCAVDTVTGASSSLALGTSTTSNQHNLLAFTLNGGSRVLGMHSTHRVLHDKCVEQIRSNWDEVNLKTPLQANAGFRNNPPSSEKVLCPGLNFASSHGSPRDLLWAYGPYLRLQLQACPATPS